MINLSGDKRRVLTEAFRVLGSPVGGSPSLTWSPTLDMDDATRADMAAWTGCIAGALTEDEFRADLADAGLADVEIRAHPPRARPRRLGDHPGNQTPAMI